MRTAEADMINHGAPPHVVTTAVGHQLETSMRLVHTTFRGSFGRGDKYVAR